MRSFLVFFAMFPISMLGCDNKKIVQPVNLFDEIDLTACLTSESENIFEIMTWNIEQFPLKEELTIELVQRVITVQKPDIIAFQEISSVSDFNKLTDALEGYENQVHITGNLNMGFMYKSSEIVIESDIQAILEGDTYALPRAPVMISAHHKNGISATLISIHLKCCGGVENYKRRTKASIQLKEYIDENLPDDEVLMLGDFNDEIYGIPDSENPFINFINDSNNYLFADMDLAKSDESDWSYPRWPSHIDHILITNELFKLTKETLTLTYDECYQEYFTNISDHRPVMIKLAK